MPSKTAKWRPARITELPASCLPREVMHCGRLCPGPVWDHTLCTMLNELHVPKRHGSHINHEGRRRTGKARYRHLLRVKWSAAGADIVIKLSSGADQPMLSGYAAVVWEWTAGGSSRQGRVVAALGLAGCLERWRPQQQRRREPEHIAGA